MTEYPYAEILRAIADGKTIQTYCGNTWSDSFTPAVLEMIASETLEPRHFRVKPATIRIGGKELTAPMREAPADNTEYWTAGLSEAQQQTWESDGYDRKWLEAGLCFTTEADAQAVADALLEQLK